MEHPGGWLVLWTVFILFMLAWMLGFVLQFRMGAIPVVIVLTTIMAFVKLIRGRRQRERSGRSI